jgi:spore germination protein YaaH
VKRIINFILLALVVVLVVIWLVFEPPLSSPLSEGSFSQFLARFPHVKTQKIVYGFLPYWNMDEVVLQPELTHLAYFSLTIDADGSIVTTIDNYTEPGYRALQSDRFFEISQTLESYDSQMHLVLSQFDNKKIEELLDDEQAQENFLLSLDSVLLAYPFSGINLDIEYAGDASLELRQQYTAFVGRVNQYLTEKYDEVELTVDVYAAAASKNMLWEIDQLNPLVDYLIIMAYDFHRSSSPVAGPVAPLLSKEGGWNESINGYLKDFARLAPTNKLLLGIPFYGYEWQTTSPEPESLTFPKTGATASYKRVKELLANRDELELTEHWDKNALAPYLSYTKNDQHYLVYFENASSITYKLEYVNQLDLAGIAIWSLGYEGNSRDLWNAVDQTLKIQN